VSTLELVVAVTRHELLAARKSRRALLVSAAYLAAACLGGLLYVLSVRAIEQQLLASLGQGDSVSGAATLSLLVGQEAYKKAVGFFAGLDPALIAPTLIDSVILPAFLWGSLVFLPFVVVLTSFDHVTQDLQNRAVCYPALRVSRRVLLAGKLLAQLTLFTLLSIVASGVLVGLAFGMLRTFNLADAVLGLPRAWVVLIPFGACYLGLATLASTLTRQPMAALLMAVAGMLALRVAGWFGAIPEEHPLALLRYLEYLSPAHYHDYLWRADLAALAGGIAAYVAFFAVFTGAAALELGRRDL
jgi:ABC-type transport system involved in multi-copper enzyme maturation permease subunit